MLFVGIFIGWEFVKMIVILMMILNSLGFIFFFVILKIYLLNES